MKLLSRSTIIIVCFILALVLGFAFNLPKYRALRELRQQIEIKTREIAFQEQYLSDLREASQKLKEHNTVLAMIEESLPPAPDLPALFAYFQRASSQNGLVLQAISPPSIEGSELISDRGRRIQFALTLSGSYASFKNFLSTLTKSARLITVRSTAFSAPAEQTGLFTFNISVEMHSY